MKRTAIGIAALAAAAGISLAACSSPPSPGALATSACQTMATATSTVNLLNPDGYVPGQLLNLQTWGTLLGSVADGQASLPQPLRRDLQPLLNVTGVTQQQVATASADCAGYGVTAAIWPVFMTQGGQQS